MLGLVAVLAAAVVAAVLELGPPTSSARTSTEMVTAAKGIVQSTVTGTGNVEPGTDVEANFQTSGTLQSLDVKDGDHVIKGQLHRDAGPDGGAADRRAGPVQPDLGRGQPHQRREPDRDVGLLGVVHGRQLCENVQESTEFVTFHPAATTTQTTATATTTSTTPVTTTQSATTPTPTQVHANPDVAHAVDHHTDNVGQHPVGGQHPVRWLGLGRQLGLRSDEHDQRRDDRRQHRLGPGLGRRRRGDAA